MKKSGQWTQEEHTSFLKGLIKYNSASQKWKLIAKEFVTTRTRTQTASHSQKYWKKLKIGLKSLDKPKKHKHCVQCSECSKWYTGRYWTADESWALKDWWVCEGCEDSEGGAPRTTRTTTSPSNSTPPSTPTPSTPSEKTDSVQADDKHIPQRTTTGKKRKHSEITEPTNYNQSSAPKTATASTQVPPVRCICDTSRTPVAHNMLQCERCHNFLHMECVKEDLNNASGDSIQQNYICAYCARDGSSSPASTESDAPSLPLKKRRLGFQ